MRARVESRLRGALEKLVLTLAFLGSAEAGGLGNPSSASYRLDTWKTEQGLPQNAVKTILQTSDGYLWLGTRFGLVRFDGITFRVFDPSQTPGFTDANCLGLTEDVQGALWMAGERHLMRYADRRWETCPLPGVDAETRIWGMCRSRAGGVWVAGERGLFRLNGQERRRYTQADGLNEDRVMAVCEDPASGVLWVHTYRAIQRRDPQTGRFTNFARLERPLGGGPEHFYLDHQGNLWTGHLDGLRRWREGQPPLEFTTREGLRHNEVTLIVEDRAENLWVVTRNQCVHRLEGGRFVADAFEADFRQDQVLALHQDREGNYWMGTNFGGLKRLQRRQMGALTTAEGLANDEVLSISEGPTNCIWFGTTGGISRLQNGQVQTVRMPPGYEDNQVAAILQDRSGAVWVGSKRLGLCQLIDGRLLPHPLTGDLEADQVYALYEDRSGCLWIGTKGGLHQIHAGQLRRFTIREGLSDNNVRGILEDHAGNLWVATYRGGVNRLRDGAFTAFTKADGLSDDAAWLLREDAAGSLWVGTEHGLNRFKDGRWFAFTIKHGLFDDTINDVLEDDEKYFWIGCNRGIFRVARPQLDEVAEGRRARVECMVFGTSDGMISSETNGENQPAACRARNGQFWFPTVRGAVTFDPRSIRGNPLPPPVVLEEVTLDRQNLPLHPQLRLEPGRGRVAEFHYTGNSLVAPDKVRYRYRLEGHDPDWTEAGNRRVAIYTNLRPGTYRFQVSACNNHGLWNPVGAEFAFTLTPYFHQTWPFYALCAGAAVAVALLVHQRRVRVLRTIQRLEAQHALDEERSRIAQDIHDELGASLTTINLLSELARRDLDNPAEAQTHVSKIMKTSRELFRSLDEIVWAANPRHDTLDSLAAYLSKYAQDYLRLAGVRCRLDIPAEALSQPLPGELRHHLFLAAKEALHNTVKHAAATEVWVRLEFRARAISIRLEDNGRGFRPADADPTRNGLANIRQRVARLGGQVDIQSAPGQGTRVNLLVQLGRAT